MTLQNLSTPYSVIPGGVTVSTTDFKAIYPEFESHLGQIIIFFSTFSRLRGNIYYSIVLWISVAKNRFSLLRYLINEIKKPKFDKSKKNISGTSRIRTWEL